MQRKYIVIAVGVLAAVIGFAWYMGNVRHELVANPDPNHTHADFAIWVDGKQMDFSGEQYMSGASTDATHEGAKDTYLHLHDGNGGVVHRHKPGLMFGQFMVTNLGLNLAHDVTYDANGGTVDIVCLFKDSVRTALGVQPAEDAPCLSGNMRGFVNGKEVPAFSLNEYVFADGDSILVTDATDQATVDAQLAALTDDACKYSKTCPWRGAPPTENCIADPEVPCTVN